MTNRRIFNFAAKMISYSAKSNEKGVSLIMLMAVMTILTIFMLAAAPVIQKEIQRSREQEAIRRGNEVAEAIRVYALTNNKLPTSMNDLLEGVPRGSRKYQILRESASKDPLSADGKWKLLRVRDKQFVQFAEFVRKYNGNVLPGEQQPVPPVISALLPQLPNTQTDPSEFEEISNVENMTCEESDEAEETQPDGFVGVVSVSKCRSVLTYYGIERQDYWVFTPLFRGTSNPLQNNQILPPPSQ